MGRMRTVVPIGEPGMTVYEILNIFSEILLNVYNLLICLKIHVKRP